MLTSFKQYIEHCNAKLLSQLYLTIMKKNGNYLNQNSTIKDNIKLLYNISILHIKSQFILKFSYYFYNIIIYDLSYNI